MNAGGISRRRAFLARLCGLLRGPRHDEQFDGEIQEHLRLLEDQFVAQGMSRAEAALTARRQFGNTTRLREDRRALQTLPSIESLWHDVRLGARMLLKNRLVTAATILSLSLALGACVAAFSLVDALILRPLPVRDPQHLIQLSVPSNPNGPDSDTFSDPLFLRLREAGRGRVDLFAISYPERPRVTFAEPGAERERVRLEFVSGDAFDRLGVVPAAGRLLAAQDDVRAGAHPVAVVSHAFWMQRFGGDPATVGRWFTLHRRDDSSPIGGLPDVPLQIVGVAEPRFRGIEPGRPTDVWLPWAMGDPYAFGNPDHHSLRVFGRLRDDVALEQGHAVLQAAFTNFRREYTARHMDPSRPTDRAARFINTPLNARPAATGPSRLRRQFERPLWILAGIAALVLLIAGSNVANLLLARTAVREREMSLRLSLGAGRGRLIQQVLAESALLAAAACVAGALFALFVAPAAVGLLGSPEDPVSLELLVDWRLVAFIGALTLLITTAFGLAPALRASNAVPMTALKSAGGRASTRLGAVRAFVVLQVAFSLVVLFVGGLLVLSFARVTSVDPGFATSGVLLLSWEPTGRIERAQRRATLVQVLDRLRDVPGVEAVSAASGMLGRGWRHNIRLPGTADEWVEAGMKPVTPGFFETMQIPLRAGRTFVRADLETERPTTIIVDEAFAARYFGREPAVGRRVDGRFDKEGTMPEVVGVVANARYDVRQPAAPTIYFPMPMNEIGTLHVRAAGDLTAIVARLREEVRAATPLFRVTTVTSQSAAITRTLLRERLLALLSGFFAIVGVVLTAVGLYGVLTYAVVQRTREIGIRVALGARVFGAVRTVLRDAAGSTLIGTACGLAGGLYASRFVETMLFEVAARDVASLALPLGTLLLATLVAAAVPAWRAARVDPVIALRNE
jgi:putative ABC transport system permease protein